VTWANRLTDRGKYKNVLVQKNERREKNEPEKEEGGGGKRNCEAIGLLAF